MNTLEEFVRTSEYLVVAHRGSSGTAPENTIAAIYEALRVGAKMVEVDVQISSDEFAVVIHDPVLGRTTNGSGKVRNFRLEELRKLDAGTWFGEKFSQEKVPELKNALLLLKDRAYVNIEIKPPQQDEDFRRRMEIIVSNVYEMGMEKHTLFSSFHHDSLKMLKAQHPELHTAAIQVPGDKRLPSEIAAEIGCEAFVCSIRELSHKRSEDALSNGLYIGVYTVNTPEEAEHVRQYNVKAIVTNFPKRIIEALR